MAELKLAEKLSGRERPTKVNLLKIEQTKHWKPVEKSVRNGEFQREKINIRNTCRHSNILKIMLSICQCPQHRTQPQCGMWDGIGRKEGRTKIWSSVGGDTYFSSSHIHRPWIPHFSKKYQFNIIRAISIHIAQAALFP